MKLIVGLGNPGKKYEYTRHNVGYYILDSYLNEVSWEEKFNALNYVKNINGEKFIFLKPLTYMNLSGEAVIKYMNYYKLDSKDLLVIQDDLDLPLGKIRIKVNSSSGGHNGIKNIIEHLKNNSFVRLKVGIGESKYDTINYVLGKMSDDEMDLLDSNLDIIFNIIEDFSKLDANELMNKYN